VNHLQRELAPVSEAAWQVIEAEAKARLTTHLAARKVVDFDGPHGWEHSATSLGRATRISEPTHGVSAVARMVMPLVELRAEFGVSTTELDDAARGALDIDLSELGDAARHIAVAENVSVLHGYPAGGIRGITESSSHEAIELGGDAVRYPNAVAAATDRLRQSGIGGPYGLAIGPESYTTIVETTEHGGFLLFEHLREILGGPLVWAPGVEGGIVVSLRGGDFLFESGQDFSVGFSRSDAQRVTLYIEESFSFRVVEPDAAVALRSAPQTTKTRSGSKS
jgi:uncharacterized linocin/CFP29 family protein